MKLYIKSYCGWCVEAVEWLRDRGYEFEVFDVTRDKKAYQHMQHISKQTLAPTLEMPDGRILADFDVAQLEKFLGECIRK